MLRVNELCKDFREESKQGRVHAVDHVSFTVEEGAFFTLLGPSGCGKTTTLRCIAGLERPESGEILVDDRVLFSGSRRVFVQANQRNIGMVFQSYAIWPHMNVFDNVAFPLRVGGRKVGKAEIRQRVEQALSVVELGHLAGRFATKLSGGQQQRLALARALVIQPSLLLLDEPLSNLDAKLRESLRFELKRLQRDQGITTVYVTHDQAEALSMSNAIAVMQEGRISQVGNPFAVYLEPENSFVADFVGSTNFIEGDVVGPVGDDEWQVTTSYGDLHVGKVVGVGKGDPCMVSIRPEHIEVLQSDSRPGPNVWTGQVRTRLFTGESMDYQISFERGELRCRTPASVRLSTGSPVVVHLPASQCTALRKG